MLDYKAIIIKRYALNLSGTQIANLGCSKSGVNDFLKRFEECKTIDFPLPVNNPASVSLLSGGRARNPFFRFLAPLGHETCRRH